MKLYIGNLPFNVTSARIRELFAQAGAVVDVYISTNRFTSKSSGFGFVEMETEAAGQNAIRLFHGYALADRLMTVQAIPQRDAKWDGKATTIVYRKFPPPVEKPDQDDQKQG